ncbi:1,3-beta-galactosyl-N-acetylhexosamine phosphorylase [Bifidobacterium bombi]|uniref:Lacto-N-biose phorylase n=1 Tax=Bifidobacterium bombi DSM 19703 TaxID=1341695 RepID=A0A080N4W3_9BIFI|nr:1,3-beta-galactosyl-N-acetylhexosamine phosphorylase [Bifidobacterium bombi]KFF31760.1 lacto-N-biose phorylase [Bifidobacterium bombi DSM 19703]
MSYGLFTLPAEENFAAKTRELAQLWGADAIRNSDGTHLDEEVKALGKKIYSAYFPARGHNEWARLHMDETPMVYLLSQRVLAEDDPTTNGNQSDTSPNGAKTRVEIPFMKTFFEEQLQPYYDADPARYWEVTDRTTGETIPTERWHVDRERDTVIVEPAECFHEYTVTFLASIIWDPVEMYNHITNNWSDHEHAVPLDVYQPDTRDFIMHAYQEWLDANPEVDVVRLTTFFYQFTLIFSAQRREKIVDWFGCACTVSPSALDGFEREYGYRMRPEDFVSEGGYNSTFRQPTRPQLDWLGFVMHTVRANVKRMVSMTHEAGKEAMMFLGDQWIGTEPYVDGFEDLGLDAVVGSVGDGTTLRMISDIKGVRYTEGRFLPYFFPDTFHEGNDPSIEAWSNWRKARRAILRSPISRMGYGGYLSLAAKFPKFVDAVTEIADEFRDLTAKTGGEGAQGSLNIAVLNTWGRMRSWMAYTVAHAKPYPQTYSYYGVLESLSGMRVNVRFISFDDVTSRGIDDEIDVVVTGGAAGTSFSGGEVWKDPALVSTLRRWVRNGGALVGLGEPSAVNWQGRFFQLADVFGVDREISQTLSVDKYFPALTRGHFITADVPANETNAEDGDIEPEDFGGTVYATPRAMSDIGYDFGEPITGTYPIDGNVTLLSAAEGRVQLATNRYGSGVGVYLSGLPYSGRNARLLERILFYAARREDEYEAYSSTNPQCETAVFPKTGWMCVINNTNQPQSTDVKVPGQGPVHVDLGTSGIFWRKI